MYNYYYLSHHGIMGQKWGDRNGPPYPLNSSTKSPREKKKEIKRFNKKVKKNWIKSHNEASQQFNSRINDINDKYSNKDIGIDSGFNTKDGQEYIKEVSKLWKELYSDSLIRNIGANPATENGFDWLESAPMMLQFDQFLKIK